MTREEAVEVLKERYLTCVGIGLDNHANRVNEAIDMAIETLSAEAVQGEWIDIDSYYRMATCSHCLKVTMFEKWGEYTRPYNFCPNCGARMTPYKGGEAE